MIDNLQTLVLDITENAMKVPQDHMTHQVYILKCAVYVNFHSVITLPYENNRFELVTSKNSRKSSVIPQPLAWKDWGTKSKKS